jgi:hypothetical protein
MNEDKEILDRIKKIKEEMEQLKLSPKQLNLVKILLANPTETYKKCCTMAGYRSYTALEDKDTDTNKYFKLSLELQKLYAQRQALITRDDVFSKLKMIIEESKTTDRVQALALAAKLLGLEPTIKTENKNTLLLKFEEDI